MTKPCASCNKQIPDVALDCVFCGARQPEVANAGKAPTEGERKPLLGVGTSEIDAVVAQAAPTQTRPTQAMQAIQLPDERTEEIVNPDPEPDLDSLETPPDGTLAPARDWTLLARVALALAGLVFVMLFFVPQGRASSWTLLESLVGADYVRQFYLLAGGIVLTALGLLPTPPVFRALMGTMVATSPVLIGAGALSGWRGVAAAGAALGLAASHLGAARADRSRGTRALVGVAILAVALLYVVPADGVVPLAAIVSMLTSGMMGQLVMGLFSLVPLAFAALSLLGLLGKDLTDVDVLLGLLMIVWGPVLVAIRGLLLEDRSQLLVAMSLLVSSLAAAICAAEVIGQAARRSS